MTENKEVLCYKKFSATDFKYPKPEWKYYEMNPDPCVDKVKPPKSGGIVSFRCYMRQKAPGESENYDMNQHMLVKSLPKRPKAQKIRAYIFQCKNLPALDDNGLSDPYVKCWDQNDKCKPTKTVEDSLDPIYYTIKEFFSDIFLAKSHEHNPIKILEGFPPFILDVWDEDKGVFEGKDDFMCRATIFADKASCRFIDEKENILHQTEYSRE